MWSQDTFTRALNFAARAHGNQRMLGSDLPYVVHLSCVAVEVLAACTVDPEADADLAAACALLHDCIEDAGVTYEEVKALFGERVADGVLALTKDESLPKAVRMEDSLARIRNQPREISMVKLADRVTNLEPPLPPGTLEERGAYLAESRQIQECLRGTSPLLERRLEEKIAAYGVHCHV
ncbi:HD domain-containing protein [Hyalangium versicolor]|uniref:HD domain-containing protein n=1 Tax=Hyalangium versicolor TaxID=2861190 RepID=UPI001CCDA7D0|nr:HD domain-containing protein [Hyalangium versicolor]